MATQQDVRPIPLSGELVVRNGPDRGINRVLLVPITLVGSSESADLRILEPLVRSVHCIITVTADGPHLRSIGGTTTVNDTLTTQRLLRHGDVISVGPVELEVHWSLIITRVDVPLAEAVDDHELPTQRPSRAWSIIKARGRLFQERQRLIAETNRERQSIEDLRQENAHLRSQTKAELDRLRALRKRFIKRWKRHWSTERERLATAMTTLQSDREQLEQAQRQFETKRLTLERENKQQKEWLAECRAKRDALETTLAQREQELADQQQLLHLERERLRADQTAFAHRRIALEFEIQALEQRISHLRTALETPPLPQPVSETLDASTDRIPLAQLADDLVDQQHSLQELVEHVARTLTDTRELGVDTLQELETILRGVLDREEQVQATSRQLLSEQARLTSWQARLTEQKVANDQQTTQLNQREHRIAKYEQRLKTLIAEWQRRRNLEVAQFQEHLAQARHTRDLAMASIRRAEHRETELQRRREALVNRELAVEQVRAMLQEQHPEYLARCERKVEATYAKHAARWVEQQQQIHAEQQLVNQLIEQAHEQWHAIARQQRQLARKKNFDDHRQYLAERDYIEQEASLAEHQAHRALAEKQIDTLRAEVNRLVKMLEQLSKHQVDWKKAA